MGKYKICGYNVEFNYQCEPFFKGQIEAYLSDFITADLIMNVKVTNFIAPLNLPCETIKNKRLYTFNNKDIIEIYSKSKNIIVCKIEYTKDYRHIEITFHDSLNNKLPEYEYIITGSYFMSFITTQGFLGLHASAINFNNEAILFSAPSGTGKSTQANLWSQVFPNVIYINDDKPLLKWENDQFYVYGSPWSGKNSINNNIKIPLKALIFLQQGQENIVEEMEDNDKLVYVIRNMHRPQEQETYEKLLDTINDLIKHTPIYLYHCNMELNAVTTLYQKLYGGEKHEN